MPYLFVLVSPMQSNIFRKLQFQLTSSLILKRKEEGSNLTLFCNATGHPAPMILWTKDGSPINNNSRIRFSIHNRLLTISNVNRTDSGHYRCVANNSLGNGTSNVSTVNILCKFSSHYCTGMNTLLSLTRV